MQEAQDNKTLEKKQRAHFLWLAKNTEGILKALNEKGSSLCDDKEFVKVCLKNEPMALQWASERLKKDFNVIKEALRRDVDAMRFVSKELSEDIEFWQKLKTLKVIDSGLSCYIKSTLLKTVEDFEKVEYFFKNDFYNDLTRVSQEVLKDEKIAKRILMKDSSLLAMFPKEIRSNKKIIKSLQESVYHQYDSFGESLRDDEEIFLKAVSIRVMNFLSASERIKSDKKILRRGIILEPGIYNLLTVEQRNDEQLFSTLLRSAKKKGFFEFKYKPRKSWCANKQIAEHCIRLDPMSLRFFKELNNDEGLVRLALSKDGRAFSYINESLKRKKELILLALKTSPYIMEEVGAEFQKDEDCCKAAVEGIGWLYSGLEASMRLNKELLLIALKESEGLVAHVPEELREDEDVMKSELKSDTLHYFSDEVRTGVLSANKLTEDGQVDYQASLKWYLGNKKAQKCKKDLEEILNTASVGEVKMKVDGIEDGGAEPTSVEVDSVRKRIKKRL